MKSPVVKQCRPSGFAKLFQDTSYGWIFDLVFGLESGIPLCCVLYYCYDNIVVGDGRNGVRAGCVAWGSDCTFTHCPSCRKKYHRRKK
jgi:hypothetical protein